MQLALGLGNPGGEYAGTRHNLGFRVVDLLGKRLGITFQPENNLCSVALGSLDDVRVSLAKPLTFMNGSGRAAAHLVENYRLDLSELLVVCDDTNLPLGKIRLRREGSDGGHRGLSSIIRHLAAESFPRLRLGIGAPPEGQDLVQFVLTDFEPAEEKYVTEMIELAVEATLCFFSAGIEETMNRFNG